jgi:hypothetical protein
VLVGRAVAVDVEVADGTLVKVAVGDGGTEVEVGFGVEVGSSGRVGVGAGSRVGGGRLGVAVAGGSVIAGFRKSAEMAHSEFASLPFIARVAPARTRIVDVTSAALLRKIGSNFPSKSFDPVEFFQLSGRSSLISPFETLIRLSLIFSIPAANRISTRYSRLTEAVP